jgi:ribonuclease D
MEVIATTSELAAACDRLARHPVITVDTEFLRETTYYPLLCVVQLASPEEAIVVDALAAGIDLKPFFELMSNERVLKVFHAARQDIEIVWHRAGILPHPIFDTQVAAMVLGYGDSIAYDQLVQRVTGRTRPTASPTGRAGRSPRSSCTTRSPMSPICATCSPRSTPT